MVLLGKAKIASYKSINVTHFAIANPNILRPAVKCIMQIAKSMLVHFGFCLRETK